MSIVFQEAASKPSIPYAIEKSQRPSASSTVFLKNIWSRVNSSCSHVFYARIKIVKPMVNAFKFYQQII